MAELGGRIRRAAIPAKLIAQGAAAATLARARVLKGDSAEDIVADPHLISVAENIARSLGEMKGAAMKIGQALSFVDVSIIPEEYRTALSILQADAPPMPYADVVKVVTEELGAPPDKAFTWFSPQPIAAASIGQVHMAHVGDREVVVKVQYPGVAKAIEADLRNAALLSALANVGQKLLAGLVGDVDVRALVDEIRDRVGEELDYRIEARNQQDFATAFAGDREILIPAVVPEYSTRRVLTTEYVDAMRWEAALQQPQELRDGWGQVISRFVYTLMLRDGLVNVDTHPGNYLFHENGHVTFLDFGCVTRWTPTQRADVQRLVAAIYKDDDDQILDAFVGMGLLHDRNAFKAEALLAPLRMAMEPLHVEQPFHHSREQLAGLIAESLRLRVSVEDLRLLRQLDCPKEYILLVRTTLGIAAVLAHLEAAVDYDRALDGLLSDVEL
jgi:predicted unusual protein kinase regulating ubiquinone biosynthesis (AarF/ABC1/UbiB family)